MAVQRPDLSLLGTWQGATIDDPRDDAQIAAAARDVRLMLVSVLDAILARGERRPDDPFIDTKLNLLDGTDFGADDPIRGTGTLYAWIQGRGLEALAGHAGWLRESARVPAALKPALLERCERALGEAMEGMEALRQQNGGRLFFMMTSAGQPVRVAADGGVEALPSSAPLASNFSDLFYAKGLAAAAHTLGDQRRLAFARELFKQVYLDIRDRAFVSDQQPLDPANVALRPVVGRHGQGPSMIAIGGATVFLQVTGDDGYAAAGRTLIDHVLAHHVQTTDDGPARRHDFWEFVDDAGEPYVDGAGVLLSDPGHACEFAGLALRHLRVCAEHDLPDSADAERAAHLRGVLRRNLDNGFHTHGLVKSLDLLTRRRVQSDIPWWPLPETVRAAAEAWHSVTRDDPAIEGDLPIPFREAGVLCHNAFVRGFVRTERHLMAVQTLSADGEPIAVIPATPDADPGYHTGLSLIDALRVIGEA